MKKFFVLYFFFQDTQVTHNEKLHNIRSSTAGLKNMDKVDVYLFRSLKQVIYVKIGKESLRNNSDVRHISSF